MNFWNNLQKPILVLAPMADVTDPAFRRIIAKYGKPGVIWTEFVSADGLFLGGREALEKDLVYDESERPIIAQFFTGRPEMMRQAAILAVELGFDGIDINMGCPDKSIEKQGGGANLIRNPARAQEIILAAKDGVRSTGKDIPVSVKTRIGYNTDELETWLPALLDTEPAVITVHARTRKEMSRVPARWECVLRAVEIRDAWRGRDSDGKVDPNRKSSTLIFGNGDVKDLADARTKAYETGCDGIMLGRAIFGNPWLFSETHPIDTISSEERLRVLVEHTHLYEKLLPHKSFAIMKKHYKAYVNGWDGAKELRVKLMEAKNADEVEQTISKYLQEDSERIDQI